MFLMVLQWEVLGYAMVSVAVSKLFRARSCFGLGRLGGLKWRAGRPPI